MSTRGFIGLVIDGQEKITYNHSDSYPSWLGLRMVQAARSIADDLGRFTELARDLKVVDEESKPTDEEMLALSKHADLEVSTGDPAEWYVLLRDLQGDLINTLEAGYMIDGHLFPIDSLFAEWGYLVDLDAGTFEVYRGFRKEPTSEGRWVGRPNAEDIAEEIAELTERGVSPDYIESKKTPSYFAAQRVATWPLTALPQEEDVLALEYVDDDE